MEPLERELIERIKSGDEMAFRQIMSKYGERIMGLAFHFTKNYQDAEDLYQETFIKVYKNIQTFRFESEFFTWVYRILANQAFNYYRKSHRMTIVDPGEEDYLWETIPNEDSEAADQVTLNNSLREEIDRALMQLSSQQRVVFILKHYEGKRIKDIATILDCTEGTIKRYLFRATHKLQTILAKA